jgi:superoxide reductase
MANLSEQIKTADWKTEKHVPVVECPDAVKAGEFFTIKASLGKAVAHPNTTEHHIRWISIYYQSAAEKAPLQVAHFEFCAHGESVKGPNQGPLYTNPEGSASVKIDSAGTFYAVALCNIHGLWQSARDIKLA